MPVVVAVQVATALVGVLVVTAVMAARVALAAIAGKTGGWASLDRLALTTAAVELVAPAVKAGQEERTLAAPTTRFPYKGVEGEGRAEHGTGGSGGSGGVGGS